MKNTRDRLNYERVKSRVQDLKAFYIMLVGYCLMIPLWIFINHRTTTDFDWFWFPTIGCGISIIAYGLFLFTAKNWEQNKIKQLMDKDQFKN